jgi:hypothetical protein
MMHDGISARGHAVLITTYIKATEGERNLHLLLFSLSLFTFIHQDYCWRSLFYSASLFFTL